MLFFFLKIYFYNIYIFVCFSSSEVLSVLITDAAGMHEADKHTVFPVVSCQNVISSEGSVYSEQC